MGIIEMEGYNDLFFHEEIQMEGNSFLNLNLPPVFDGYDEPLLHKGGEHSYYDAGSSIDFNRHPKFDVYGEEDTVVTPAKEPFFTPGYGCKFKFKKFNNSRDESTMDSAEFQDHPSFYLVEFQLDSNAATTKGLSSTNCLFGSMAKYNLTRLVHGGWRGGRHKLKWCEWMLKLGGRDELWLSIADNSSPDSSLLQIFVIQVAYLLIVLVFDPGGVRLRELRSILF